MTGTTDDYLHEAEIYDVLWADLNSFDLPFLLSMAAEFGGPLLEIGCGTGRVLLPCMEHVDRAVGVDRSPSMLEQGRANLSASGVPEERVRLVEADLRSFDLGERFNLVLAGGQTMFHLETDDDWLAALATIRDHLQPGGRFVAGVPVFQEADFRDYHKKQLFVDEIRHPRTGLRIALWDYSTFDFEKQSITRRRVSEVLDEQGLVIERRHDIRKNIYRFPPEMRKLLEQAGFRIEAEYGDYDRGPYTEESEDFVWVATVEGRKEDQPC
ncbi:MULTISPECIES: class I SAM-dependent methyltransferase [Streptomyces]|uniref:Methyltransferase domain-containing protein n=1 Tax=Streptomyces venezuelae TaxID=54571 RepID=A0A5P2BJC5_STRVZ|nr:class I SAM-dependent methyltransferase [Streptomyces venezuelae]MYY87408.1 methyltransferase domain-containing protein [Streptomyces sp. SID335]MYZ17022.1 methyltransferase domain-containing protein [Streptomyces sp. SID337]NDZ89738.1 class I SAM-dependent methyltransferase [Streptomyces sp. SID10115]NEA00258.1 class I SAM-dependent methyltransferase [Streptomyces sp. SID10116]NEB45480.1 class I SAM-dependent methyltransferase [Streptomyces sp. SID339]